ncbi:hypothetical protein [Laspinema palackyanum]|uniref:hypothetical protein n=1 Tax=Laspinema palackyanum TaxID=3231601 RepID=UPI00349F43D5
MKNNPYSICSKYQRSIAYCLIKTDADRAVGFNAAMAIVSHSLHRKAIANLLRYRFSPEILYSSIISTKSSITHIPHK